MADNENAVTPTPENPIPDVDEIKPGIPTPAWPDEGGGGGGTGGGALVVHIDVQTSALDKTWQEIYDAAKVGTVLLINDENTTISHGLFSRINIAEEFYQVWFYLISDKATVKFVAESADDYPLFAK